MSITPFISDDGDFLIDGGGRPVMIEGKEKLHQDMRHIILCPRGDNIFHPLYGSEVALRVGYPIKPKTTAMKIKESVIHALSYYRRIQTIQAKYQQQAGSEVLRRIATNKVWSVNETQQLQQVDAITVSISNPVTINIWVHCLTLEYDEITIPFRVFMRAGRGTVSSGFVSHKFAKYDTGSQFNTGKVYKPSVT